MKNIPLVNLERQYEKIKYDIYQAIDTVLNSRKFILGPTVEKFEDKFSKMHKCKYCVGCSSGTSAIKLALQALGVKKGDEVITAPNTFIATVGPIIELGATPVFVDIGKDYLINPKLIEEKITENTKVILPVHLYGLMCKMDKIQDIANEHNLKIIEDSAQAHLATYKGHYPGYYSDIATFSFYPGKNLGAYGDAGALLTNNKGIYDKLQLLRNHGRTSKYEHLISGSNERMDAIQAAVLSVKLKYINRWTIKRRKNAKLYKQELDEKYITPKINEGHVWHLYVIQSHNRNKVRRHLEENGIQSGIHYPIPLHLQPALKYLGYKDGDFPVTEDVTQKIISLPMCPELSRDEIYDICYELNKLVF